MNQFCLEYDKGYGIDRRSGWTVCVDGRVIVQFRRWAAFALVEAWMRIHC
jgi:hypothetical protein